MKSVVKIAFLLLAIPAMFSCSKQNTEREIGQKVKVNADTNINQFILDKFKDHRIVMIADAGHGDALFMSRVTSFLNYWVKIAKTDKNAPRNIVLAIEQDSLAVKRIEKYAKTHNFQDLMEGQPWPLATTANLEFYWQIGEIIRRVDSCRTEGVNLKFAVLGPEKVIDINSWSFARRDTFFIFERDTVSSNIVINYLEANPESRVLMYYGREHLRKDKELKEGSNMKANSFYMAYYFDQEFGDKLYRINQLPKRGLGEYIKAFMEPDTSYIIENRWIGKFLNPFLQPFDATIIVYENDEPNPSLQTVKSKNLGYLALNHEKTFYTQNNNYYLYGGIFAAEYLAVLTGQLENIRFKKSPNKIPSGIDKWAGWLNDPQNDLVKNIISQKSNRLLLDEMKSCTSDSDGALYGYLLNLDTGLKWGYNLRSADENRKAFCEEYVAEKKAEREDNIKYIENCLDDESNRIIITDLVQLLWVGTNEEKREAVEELQKRTGQSFISPPEWMAWWRANYEKL